MFEKGCASDAGCPRADRTKFLASVVFSGGAQHKSLAAVFEKGSTFVGFVMNHGFHANGDEWMFVVVVFFLDMRVC
jgi:hypothetical protein